MCVCERESEIGREGGIGYFFEMIYEKLEVMVV